MLGARELECSVNVVWIIRWVEVWTDETRNHPKLKATLGRMEQQHGQQLWPPSKGRPLKVEFLERLAMIHGYVYRRSLKAQLMSGWARHCSSSFTDWEPLRNDAFHCIMKSSSCFSFTHSLKSNLSCPIPAEHAAILHNQNSSQWMQLSFGFLYSTTAGPADLLWEQEVKKIWKICKKCACGGQLQDLVLIQNQRNTEPVSPLSIWF